MASAGSGVAAMISVALIAASVIRMDDAPELPPPTERTGYRVEYRIEDRSGEAATGLRREVLEVRRPFDGRLVATGAEGFLTARVTNREFQWQLGEDDELQFGLRRVPGRPVRDVSYTALVDAVRADKAVVLGLGESLGHPCTWFALKDPVPDPPALPTEHSRVESCVTPDGILLRQLWTIDSETVLMMEAVELSLETPPSSRFLPGLDPDEVEVTRPEAAQALRSQFVVADETKLPKPSIAIDPPPGWKVARRSGVVRSAAASGRALQTNVVAYRNGDEIVVVEHSLRRDDDPTWTTGEGSPIDVPVGNGRLVYDVEHVEVRITGDGFAKIEAPDRATALAFARRAS